MQSTAGDPSKRQPTLIKDSRLSPEQLGLLREGGLALWTSRYLTRPAAGVCPPKSASYFAKTNDKLDCAGSSELLFISYADLAVVAACMTF